MDRNDLQIELIENECLLADGFDSALIGITDGLNSVAVYDSNLCIQVLIKEGMKEIDAIEHFYSNVLGSYVGDKTPIFIKQLTTNI
tara:strand:+ start:529 stop:786 length:258 start_codon:yes stop_codon:yes gene_type:complete